MRFDFFFIGYGFCKIIFFGVVWELFWDWIMWVDFMFGMFNFKLFCLWVGDFGVLMIILLLLDLLLLVLVYWYLLLLLFNLNVILFLIILFGFFFSWL